MSDIEQRSPEWFAARLGKVTASRISAVLASKPTATYENYLARLAAERFTGKRDEEGDYQNTAMRIGVEREPAARSEYEFWFDEHYGSKPMVVEVGFIQHPLMGMAGASPDGLVGEKGCLEIKCPEMATHQKTLLGGHPKAEYLYQMQFQMDCTGREWCDFVSYHPGMGRLSVCVQRVMFDEALSYRIITAVRAFETEVQVRVAKLEAL
jgi:putative phage-type endonuclease